jgi:hypothetical protein
VVFTLPAQLRPLARAHPRAVYELLFAAVRVTLLTLAREHFGALPGITVVLHTWTRELGYHPHVHCIVTAGGLALDRASWIPRQEYLFPVARMKALFRAQLLEGLDRLIGRRELPVSQPDWLALQRSLPPQDKWVVYIEPPFGRSTHVLAYLGRYTHRVAISDARVVAIGSGSISFITRDDHVMQLSLPSFVGRFLLHVLPRAFHKIRHLGLYAPGSVRKALVQARLLIGEGDRDDPDDLALPPATEPTVTDSTWDATLQRLTGVDPRRCPRCGHGPLLRKLIQPIRPRRARTHEDPAHSASRSPP